MRCKKMTMHRIADRRERIRRTSSRGPEISNIQFAVRPRRNLRIGPLWYMEDESKRSIYLSLISYENTNRVKTPASGKPGGSDIADVIKEMHRAADSFSAVSAKQGT